MKNYYSTLGVSPIAHAAEIKRAYRKLALQYHPDKNPDPSVAHFFKEVNEAYDVLGDPQKRYEYDQRLLNPVYTAPVEPSVQRHRDPAYRRRAQTTYAHKPSEQFILMQKSLPFMRKVSWTGFFVMILIIVDVILPPHIEKAKIVSFRTTQYRTTSQEHLVTESGEILRITDDARLLLDKGEVVELVRSPIFRIIKRVQSTEFGIYLTNLATIYCNFKFVPILLLMGTVIGLFFAKKVEFSFNIGLINLVALIVTVILLVV